MKKVLVALILGVLHFLVCPNVNGQEEGDYEYKYDNGAGVPKTNFIAQRWKCDSVYFHNPNTGKIMYQMAGDITIWNGCPLNRGMSKCLGMYLFVDIKDVGTFYFRSDEDALEKYISTNRSEQRLSDGGIIVTLIYKGPNNDYDVLDWTWYFMIVPQKGIPITIVRNPLKR